MRKIALLASALAMGSALAMAEQLVPAEFRVAPKHDRTLFTTENSFPETGQLQAGYEFQNREFELDGSIESQAVSLRYGLMENVATRVRVPFVSIEDEFGGDESGMGDVILGFDLLAYEDIFRYPYVIPHLDIGFATGDEEVELGGGETMIKFGVSVGTVVYDVLHYVADVSYAMDYDVVGEPTDDAMIGSLSMIWDISERFSLVGEASVTSLDELGEEQFTAGGGMTYAWSEKFSTTFFAGMVDDEFSGEESMVSLKANYTF